jgi:antitoxin (DNA-binding transcriptional repressor) of toxin-antitoxin stability system
MPESKTISMLELRDGLSGVLSEVQAGSTYTITRFGSPIATLGPAYETAHAQLGSPESFSASFDASGPTRRLPPEPLEVKAGQAPGDPEPMVYPEEA